MRRENCYFAVLAFFDEKIEVLETFPAMLEIFETSVCVCVCVSRRCVCPTVFQGAAAGRYTLGTPREIFEFQFCECDSVNEIW